MAGRFLSYARKEARKRLRRLTRPSVVTYDGLTLPIPDIANEEIRQSIYCEDYEWAERALIPDLVRPDDRVLEIGAALGAVSMAILRAGPEASLHFEANPQMVEAAQATFAANNVSADLRAAAVTPDAHGADTATLLVGDAFWSASLTHPMPDATGVEAPAVRLSDVLADFRPTVLVIDIEGGECALLTGAALPGVRAVALELHRRKTGLAAQSALIAHMLAIGFHVDFTRSIQEQIILTRDA